MKSVYAFFHVLPFSCSTAWGGGGESFEITTKRGELLGRGGLSVAESQVVMAVGDDQGAIA